MVRLLTKEELVLERGLVDKLRSSIFIYPTDSMYCIGCDATNEVLVQKLRDIKKDKEKPFPVIVPEKSWILKYCSIGTAPLSWLKKLPGIQTVVMGVKKRFLADSVSKDMEKVRVKMPDHWFADIIKKMDMPVIATSVNIVGEDFMSSIEDLNPEIKRRVDFIIYEGPIKGQPPVVFNVEENSE